MLDIRHERRHNISAANRAIHTDAPEHYEPIFDHRFTTTVPRCRRLLRRASRRRCPFAATPHMTPCARGKKRWFCQHATDIIFACRSSDFFSLTRGASARAERRDVRRFSPERDVRCRCSARRSYSTPFSPSFHGYCQH
jgi:hypothetical protein